MFHLCGNTCKSKERPEPLGLITARVNLKLGKPDTVMIFAQDITERQKTEEALEQSEEKYRESWKLLKRAFWSRILRAK